MKITNLLLLFFAIPNLSTAMDRPLSQSDRLKLLNHRLMMQSIVNGDINSAFLMKAMNSDDPKEAYEIYSQLTETDSNEPWHEIALLLKGQALLKGNGTLQNKSEALKCFQECYKMHKSSKALLSLGDYYEQEATLPGNFKIAADMFKKGFNAGDPMAGYRLARLIYNENIPPVSQSEIDDIIKYTAPGVKAGLKEPLYLFASVLLDNNHALFTSHGLPAFLGAAKQGDASSALQLGILFKNGLYVPKNEKLAQELFNKALAMEDTPENILAKAYMYKNGVGIPQNPQLANILFTKARSSITANLEFVDRLFAKDNTLDFVKASPDTPIKLALKPLLPEPLNLLAETPKALETKSSKVTKESLPAVPVGKREKIAAEAPATVKEVVPAIKPALPPFLPQQIKCKTLLDRCNALSLQEDGSSLELDLMRKLILIHDPKYKNEFVVPFDESELNYRVNLVSLRYDDRINQWFNRSLKSLKSDDETRWKINTHRFGRAVDYLMQVIGVKNPILNQAKKNQFQLMHAAESITQKNKGHFEYTFRKEGSKNFIFHRMYRPYGDMKEIKH